MEDFSENLELAADIGRQMRRTEKGITNKRILVKYAGRIDINVGSDELRTLIASTPDHIQMTNIFFLSGLAIALQLQWEALIRKMEKFNAEWNMYKMRTDKPKRPRGPRAERQMDVVPDYEDMLEAAIELPELARREELPADHHILPEAQEAEVFQEVPLAPTEDIFDFGTVRNEDDNIAPVPELIDVVPAVEPEPVPLPEAPSAVDETQIGMEPPMPREERRPHIVPRRPSDRRRNRLVRHKPRTEQNEVAAAFHHDYHEVPNLEVLEEEDLHFNYLLPKFKVVKFQHDLVHQTPVSQIRLATTISGVEEAVVPQAAEGDYSHVVPVEIDATMPQLPPLPVDEEAGPIVPMTTPPALGVEELRLPQAPQFDITVASEASIAVDTSEWLLHDRMRYIHSLRTIHPGVELTIQDLTPHPHTRLSITTTFMVLSELHRKKILRISTDSKGYLTTVVFM